MHESNGRSRPLSPAHPSGVGVRSARRHNQAPNPWGLHGVHGKVWEWVQDWHGDRYDAAPVTDPKRPSRGSSGVVRGGSWHVTSTRWRSSFRKPYEPDDRGISIGFRPALSPKAGIALLPRAQTTTVVIVRRPVGGATNRRSGRVEPTGSGQRTAGPAMVPTFRIDLPRGHTAVTLNRSQSPANGRTLTFAARSLRSPLRRKRCSPATTGLSVTHWTRAASPRAVAPARPPATGVCGVSAGEEPGRIQRCTSLDEWSGSSASMAWRARRGRNEPDDRRRQSIGHRQPEGLHTVRSDLTRNPRREGRHATDCSVAGTARSNCSRCTCRRVCRRRQGSPA